MDVGIAGAGAIAMGYAAFLLNAGHTPSIWSPSGARTQALLEGEPLTIIGAIEGQFTPDVCKNVKKLAEKDVIILALPAYGHRQVIDALVPYIEARHCVIISGHLSFAALYFSKKLAARGIQILVVAWNTTALTAKAPISSTSVRVGIIRKNIDMAVVPKSLEERAHGICASMFGDVFTVKDDILTITLSNLNPQNHLGIALCNLTRIERGEEWQQNSNITPVVGKLLKALDQERVQIAKSLGKKVRTIDENMALTLNVEGISVSEMYQIQAERGNNPPGPTDINTRYILEDVPFGLITTLYLAKLAKVATPMHESGVKIIEACYGRNFLKDNDLLSELGKLDLSTLRKLMLNGYPTVESTSISSNSKLKSSLLKEVYNFDQDQVCENKKTNSKSIKNKDSLRQQPRADRPMVGSLANHRCFGD